MAEVLKQQLTLPLSTPDAVQKNYDLMQAFHDALEEDPAADLLSVVETPYLRAHQRAQYRELSKAGSEAGRYNLRTVNSLRDEVIACPEIDLRDRFPSDYARTYKLVMPKEKAKEKDTEPQHPAQPHDWLREKLDGDNNAASIRYPLSDQASALLQKYPETNGYCHETSLAASLKMLVLQSERLFELSSRGAVVKCSDEIVIKVSTGSTDLTEYHNLQYLADRAGDLPIPRPHGVVTLGWTRFMFMSYVPGISLDKVWRGLPHESKLSVQQQLDMIFSRLRSLRQDDGPQLGGAGGEGVKDWRIMEVFSRKGITTAEGFDKWQFSAKHRVSPHYVRLLRSFLEEQNETLQGSVFTHGDLKKSNVMVKQDPVDANAYTVTGIIDWEDSGFYPEYFESTMLANGQTIVSDDDWYLYVPGCISPLRFPVRWLVDRLWGNLLWTWRTGAA